MPHMYQEANKIFPSKYFQIWFEREGRADWLRVLWWLRVKRLKLLGWGWAFWTSHCSHGREHLVFFFYQIVQIERKKRDGAWKFLAVKCQKRNQNLYHKWWKKKKSQVTSGMGLKKTHTHTIETYEQIKQISFGFNTCIWLYLAIKCFIISFLP